MKEPEQDAPPSESLSRDGEEAARRMAAALCLALVALTLVRAVCLGGEFFDGYDVRAEAQRLLSGTGIDQPPFRSTALILAGAAFEAVGLGWVGLALLSACSYLLLVLGTARLAAQLGARPWVCAAAALLVATDHLTWVYAAHGMSGVPAAATCAWLLVLACSESCSLRRAVGVGLLLGLAALLRPTLGLLGLALVAGFRHPWSLSRLAVAAVVSVLTYLLVSTTVFAFLLGGLSRGWAAHAQLVTFMGEQVAESQQRYGGRAPPFALFLAVLRSQPALLLAVPGAVLAWRAGVGGARIVLVCAALHLTYYQVKVHHEARYLLPVLPALAGLAALCLERLAQERLASRRAPALVVLALMGSALVWSAPFEIARLRDPVVRSSFPARIAQVAQGVAGPDARYVWTTTHTFPVVPRVVHEQGAYPGDPWFGIFHVGPHAVGYHLGAKVRFTRILGPGGRPLAGLITPAELRDFVRRARHDDGTPFRVGDVLLVGIRRLSPSWDVRARPLPAFRVGVVIPDEQGGLDVTFRRLEPGAAEAR